MFIRFDRIHERNRQTDRRKPHYGISRAYASIARQKRLQLQLALLNPQKRRRWLKGMLLNSPGGVSVQLGAGRDMTCCLLLSGDRSTSSSCASLSWTGTFRSPTCSSKTASELDSETASTGQHCLNSAMARRYV